MVAAAERLRGRSGIVFLFAAAGRPILMIGDPEGEFTRLVIRHDCAAAVPAGDGAALGDAVLALADDPVRRSEMGRRARAMLDEHFARYLACAR